MHDGRTAKVSGQLLSCTRVGGGGASSGAVHEMSEEATTRKQRIGWSEKGALKIASLFRRLCAAPLAQVPPLLVLLLLLLLLLVQPCEP